MGLAVLARVAAVVAVGLIKQSGYALRLLLCQDSAVHRAGWHEGWGGARDAGWVWLGGVGGEREKVVTPSREAAFEASLGGLGALSFGAFAGDVLPSLGAGRG
jgi:hypothetical protein